jgi:hypothetical protein
VRRSRITFKVFASSSTRLELQFPRVTSPLSAAATALVAPCNSRLAAIRARNNINTSPACTQAGISGGWLCLSQRSGLAARCVAEKQSVGEAHADREIAAGERGGLLRRSVSNAVTDCLFNAGRRFTFLVIGKTIRRSS